MDQVIGTAYGESRRPHIELNDGTIECWGIEALRRFLI